MNDYRPLAERMRPKILAEVRGQDHLIGPDGVITRQLSSGHLPNMILAGSPGTGKTTIARLIAKEGGAHFVELSAVAAGTADVRRVVKDAKELREKENKQTLLFLDEIHRFNKAQQDALLPHVENGTLRLVGATTENPHVSVNRALLSRMSTYRLHKHTRVSLTEILDEALRLGLGDRYSLTDDAREYLLVHSARDARVMLSWLERAASLSASSEISQQTMEEASAGMQLRYDASGDWHYNTISAYIKSMRAGNSDDAVMYLGQMLAAGEDPVFIARRLVIFASEDVGLADNHALPLAHSAMFAAQNIGMPECRIPLSHATIYCANAKKDRSAYMRINEAMEQAEKKGNQDVPRHLRNSQWHP